MIDKSIFAAVAACAVALLSPFADGEELYDFEFLHLEKAVGRYNDDPGPRLDPGSRPGLDPARCRNLCDPPWALCCAPLADPLYSLDLFHCLARPYGYSL